jgi:sortase A
LAVEARERRVAQAVAVREQKVAEAEAARAQQRAEKEERRQAHAIAVAEAREADAAAATLLKESRIEAKRVRKLRKAEDAEVRRRRKVEDLERRKAIAAADGVRFRKKRRWSMWFGLSFVVVGLALLGYVGWQLWGTNWVSHQKQERIVADVQEEWKIAPSSTLSRNGTPVVRVPEGQVSALVRIPAFGDNYVIPVLEGTSDKVLAAGFGHFDNTADPGQVGNYALAAHRVTHGEPLRDMPKLEPGDEIIVETAYATYTYELTTGGEDLRVTFKDGWVVAPLPDNPRRNGVEPRQIPGQKLITLTTCAELFHTDDRLIAFGILTSKVDRL